MPEYNQYYVVYVPKVKNAKSPSETPKTEAQAVEEAVAAIKNVFTPDQYGWFDESGLVTETRPFRSKVCWCVKIPITQDGYALGHSRQAIIEDIPPQTKTKKGS